MKFWSRRRVKLHPQVEAYKCTLVLIYIINNIINIYNSINKFSTSNYKPGYYYKKLLSIDRVLVYGKIWYHSKGFSRQLNFHDSNRTSRSRPRKVHQVRIFFDWRIIKPTAALVRFWNTYNTAAQSKRIGMEMRKEIRRNFRATVGFHPR